MQKPNIHCKHHLQHQALRAAPFLRLLRVLLRLHRVPRGIRQALRVFPTEIRNHGRRALDEDTRVNPARGGLEESPSGGIVLQRGPGKTPVGRDPSVPIWTLFRA